MAPAIVDEPKASAIGEILGSSGDINFLSEDRTLIELLASIADFASTGVI